MYATFPVQDGHHQVMSTTSMGFAVYVYGHCGGSAKFSYGFRATYAGNSG